ncbi:hypothetical protein FNV43_RR02314 [Rhamnella rubrinervis]|uniref:Uncharacterized protein n=1 Tax=Rhamnella rubrinervis TaxID=2594499 RepID=A0A8K0MSV4_9ROSA|nr:hypothetical protein FNV43_RR02314 [Rhamnella rubrinervis]
MDACRSSLVCRLFRSAADSDVVWGRFLPHDHLQILSQSDLASSMHWLSKKELFFRLSHCPVLVGDDRNRVQEGFQLNGETHPGIGSGYQIGNSRDLHNLVNACFGGRFSEVARLDHVWLFEIEGRIETNILSQKTTYTAYFVYKLKENISGFHLSITIRVYFEGQVESDGDKSTCTLVINDPNPPPRPRDRHNLPRDRGDGWMEIEIGEFYNDCGDAGLVICRLFGLGAAPKRGLIVEGIELRPKA